MHEYTPLGKWGMLPCTMQTLFDVSATVQPQPIITTTLTVILCGFPPFWKKWKNHAHASFQHIILFFTTVQHTKLNKNKQTKKTIRNWRCFPAWVSHFTLLEFFVLCQAHFSVIIFNMIKDQENWRNYYIIRFTYLLWFKYNC